MSSAEIVFPFLEISFLWLLVLVARYGPHVCTGLESADAVPGVLSRVAISVGWIASLLAWALLIVLAAACFAEFFVFGAGFAIIICVGGGWLCAMGVAVPAWTFWRQRRPDLIQTTRQASSPIA